VAVEAVSTWSGFYIGGNIGYGTGRARTSFDPYPAGVFTALAPTTLRFDETGALGGGQIGYNWQAGSFVYGLEADIQKSDLSGSIRQSPIIAVGGVVRLARA
jgi:outer membrane immunogenic protein